MPGYSYTRSPMALIGKTWRQWPRARHAIDGQSRHAACSPAQGARPGGWSLLFSEVSSVLRALQKKCVLHSSLQLVTATQTGSIVGLYSYGLIAPPELALACENPGYSGECTGSRAPGTLPG